MKQKIIITLSLLSLIIISGCQQEQRDINAEKNYCEQHNGIFKDLKKPQLYFNCCIKEINGIREYYIIKFDCINETLFNCEDTTINRKYYFIKGTGCD